MASRSIAFNGTTYSLPGLGDTDWSGQVNAWMDDVSGNAATKTTVQTLTNKTLTAPTITSPTITGTTTIAVETWVGFAFAGTWANTGGGNEVGTYMKDPFGFVHLKGMVGGGGAATIFTLPAGYRPGLTQNFAAGTTADGVTMTGGLVQISTAGVVSLSIGSRVAVFLDGLIFKAV